jgi:hypothetical protein
LASAAGRAGATSPPGSLSLWGEGEIERAE